MTNKKEIAIIIPGGLGTGKNNIGVPVMEQIIQLLSRQFEVTVFQLYKANDTYKSNGFVLLDFKSGNRVIQYVHFFLSFYKTNRKKKFDVVHGFWVWPCGFLAVVLGKIFNIKSIASVLGGDAASVPEIKYGHLRKYFSRTMILWSLKNADEAVALTQYLSKKLYRAGLRRQLKIIPWGVDPALFQFHQKPLQQPVQFLHIANLHRVKDQRTLLRSFEIIQRVVPSLLTIIGEGPEAENVNQLIRQLKLQHLVTIRGHHPYRELPTIYHQSDILLHTSIAEGQSEVVTEAMSCGTFVAGTDVGFLHDHPDCCIAVPVGDYIELAKSVLIILQDERKMTQIRERARRCAGAHSITWTVGQIAGLYLP